MATASAVALVALWLALAGLCTAAMAFGGWCWRTVCRARAEVDVLRADRDRVVAEARRGGYPPLRGPWGGWHSLVNDAYRGQCRWDVPADPDRLLTDDDFGRLECWLSVQDDPGGAP